MNRAQFKRKGNDLFVPALVKYHPDGSHARSPFYDGEEHPLCVWDECDAKAVEACHIIEPDPKVQANVWWFFCCDQHRELWRNSPRNYGRATPGAAPPRYL